MKVANKTYATPILSKQKSVDVTDKSHENLTNQHVKIQLRSPSFESQKSSGQTNNTDTDYYSTNSFCTVLNKTDVSCCSRKKPDEFLRTLLFKLLKYCKNFKSPVREEPTVNTGSANKQSFQQNFTIDSKVNKNESLINLETGIYYYFSLKI